ELRTPLTAVRGYVGLMNSRRPMAPEKQKAMLDSMEKSIERLVGIVNEITDISQLREKRMYFQKAPCDLNRMIALISYDVQPLLEQRQLSLETNIESALPQIF